MKSKVGALTPELNRLAKLALVATVVAPFA